MFGNVMTNDTFVIESLIYIPVGNHHPMFNRPYIVNATDSAINTIVDRMQETQSAKVTPTILGNATSGIIQCTAVPYGTPVDSNWISTRRFAFLLKVKSVDPVGNTINSYIHGFTNYDGINQSTGSADPQLTHHINNVIETCSFEFHTPMGIIRKEKLLKIYNVFSGNLTGESYSQRPTDVLENINVLNVLHVMGDNQIVSGFNLSNQMNQFNNNLIGSTVDNDITSEYLSKILTTGLLHNKSKEIHLGSYEVTEQNSIETKLPEPSVNDNRFIRYLSLQAGFKTVRETFTLGNLMAIDNTIYNRFEVFNITKNFTDPNLSATPEVGDYWSGRDPVTVKAYSLIENSVSLAIKYGFSKLFFIASNTSNPLGNVDIVITNYASKINLDAGDFNFLLEFFKQKFLTDIFLPESSSGVTPLHMEVYVDILGTSKIFLSYSGYPANWYTIPTIANSLFSPVVTVDKSTLDYTTEQLNNVISAISYAEPNTHRIYF